MRLAGAIGGTKTLLVLFNLRVKNVRIDNDMPSVDLLDGRTISIPLK